jgi:hypothetical protein
LTVVSPDGVGGKDAADALYAKEAIKLARNANNMFAVRIRMGCGEAENATFLSDRVELYPLATT